MHPRNPYCIPPDFLQLAESYPLLKPFVYTNKHRQPSINFKDAAGQRHLTEALLHRDFGLKIELPSDRLCPAVPNRLNYVLWIQDVLAAASSALSNPSVHNDGVVRGIDIGTGASVIYPLLGCASSPNWSFIATDVDKETLIAAEKNIVNNALQNRIVLVQVNPSGSLFRHLFEENMVQQCDFLMCNPPFYGSKDEVRQAAEDKEYDPSAVCTGADVEMVTPGGETGFIQRIVEESVAIGARCRFYTSLLGKHSSITTVVGSLRSLQISNYGLTEFVQGQTRRWGIIWSLGDERLPDSLIRSTSDSLHTLLPLPNTFRQAYPSVIAKSHQTLLFALRTLEELCSELEGVVFLPIPSDPESGEVFATVSAKENAWSRKARRMLEKRRKEASIGLHGEALGGMVGTAPKLHLTIRCSFSEEGSHSKSTSDPSALVLQATWTRGKDRELFETFWSHLSRKFSDRAIA